MYSLNQALNMSMVQFERVYSDGVSDILIHKCGPTLNVNKTIKQNIKFESHDLQKAPAGKQIWLNV